jgi:hypothetical protein
MFEVLAVEELGADVAADELVAARDRILSAEADQFRLAAHWADLHDSEFVDDCLRLLPGEERAVPAGADGCPRLAEFAGAELAALLGRSTTSGEQLIADAVNVRHRHPLLWAGIAEGRIRVWVASKVARRCAAARLTLEQALWVDSQTTPYLPTLPMTRFFQLVEARIAAADPEGAAARAEAEALARFVRAGATDEHGLRTFVARAHAGDVTYLVAVLDRIAAILAAQGDQDPVDVRRATALRILANPARALQLLTAAAVDPAEHDPASDCIAWMRDSSGHALAGVPLRGDLHDLEEPDPGVDGLFRGELLGGGPAEDHAEPVAHTELLRQVLVALDGFDATRFDPVTIFHVHLSEASLAHGRGVARVEDLGPMVLDQLKSWLAGAGHRIKLRPVLDARTVAPVDRYEFTKPMQEVVTARVPYEVFPFGTLPSRKCDLDHPAPYSAKGPPTQTGLHNVGPLSRKHHRIKTFGRWVLLHPEPDVYWWRTPTGHWLCVDPRGTRHHGRDAELDRRWVPSARRGTPDAA